MMEDSTILLARDLAVLDQPRNESSRAWHMPPEHFCDAVRMELAGVPQKRIAETLVKEGLPEGKVPGRTAWSDFWRDFKPFLRLARRRRAAEGANETAAELQRSPAEFDAATLDLVRQLAFELADSDAPDPKGVKSLVSILLKNQDQRLKERQIAISERRMDLLEKQESAAKAALNDANLSPQQRESKFREIFGMPTTA